MSCVDYHKDDPEELPEATGTIGIEITTDCPHCDEYIDLLSENDVELSCEQGDFMKEVFGGDRWGVADCETEAKCLHCNGMFKIGLIEY